jgi:maleate cis-trans isomerase
MSNFGGGWRGMLGVVFPTKGSGSLEEMVGLMPEGLGMIPLYLSVRRGTLDEFGSAIPRFEEKIAELSDDGVDAIFASGTPPFMLAGYEAERRHVETWQAKYNVPIFTSGRNQIRGLKALGIKRFVGIGYDFEDTEIPARYFKDAGFDVLGLERLPGRWEDIGAVSQTEVYRQIRNVFRSHRNAQGIYIQGQKIRMLNIVEELEQDLGVPVLHPGICAVWEAMSRFEVRQPRRGYGRLLAELPALPDVE